SRASRASSSELFPPGIPTGAPSRVTATGPSTEISSTARVYGRVRALSARRQRRPAGSSAMAPEAHRQIVRRLLVGDEAAIRAVSRAARTSDDPLVLVAAALFAAGG